MEGATLREFRRVGVETVCGTISALLPVLYSCLEKAATPIAIPDTTQQVLKRESSSGAARSMASHPPKTEVVTKLLLGQRR